MARSRPLLLAWALLATFAAVAELPGRSPILSAAEPTDAKRPVTAELRALTEEKLKAARQGLETTREQFLAGRGVLDHLLCWSVRVRDTQLDLATKKEERVAAHEDHWKRMKEVEEVSQERFNQGRVAIQYLMEAKYSRIEAEIRLREAKGK